MLVEVLYYCFFLGFGPELYLGCIDSLTSSILFSFYVVQRFDFLTAFNFFLWVIILLLTPLPFKEKGFVSVSFTVFVSTF